MRGFILTILLMFATSIEAESAIGSCYMGTQRDNNGKIRWVLSKQYTQCDQILPGGMKNGVINETDVWTLEQPFFTQNGKAACEFIQSLNPCLSNPCHTNGTFQLNESDRSYKCEGTDQYTVEKDDTQVCPTEWSTKNDSCYNVINTYMNWTQARDHCQTFGNDTHLVGITDDDENIFVSGLLTPGRRYWIGLNDIDTTGSLTWTSGNNLQYNNWADGEPNNFGGDEDCVFIRDGIWHDTQCINSYRFICEQGQHNQSM